MLERTEAKQARSYCIRPFGDGTVLLVGFRIVSLGTDGLINIVWGTLALALLSYLTKPIFGKNVN